MGNRIMAVDDSRILQLQLGQTLEGTDYEVAAYCQDGETAVARYEEVKPDLVTMDIIMPGIDGLEAARMILEDHPEARIVMVSSLAYDDTLDEAKEIGAKAFIYKPFEREEVLSTLGRVLSEA